MLSRFDEANDSSPTTPTAQSIASSSLISVIPNSANAVDTEEEAAFYDEFVEHKPDDAGPAPRPLPFRASSPSLLSNDIWVEDNTGSGKTFASDVKVTGWTTVGDTKAGGYIVASVPSSFDSRSPTFV
ncbi:hypothetical protein FRB99_008786 [Tulasnella sp. 403]|nr:hypothetical protein FRB99_008786 [Tulasnella sp. 403]